MTFPDPQATWSPAGEQEILDRGTGSTSTRFIAPGTSTGGEFGLFENIIGPGKPGAVPHYHTGFSESFYVISGKLAVLTGRDWRVASSGDFVYVPPRGMHAFRSASHDEPTRFLILFVPGAPREHYFRGLDQFVRRDVAPTQEEVDAFALECDQVNVRDWQSNPL